MTLLRRPRYARQGGYPHFAILGAVTAIELITRYMLVEPLLQGAFLSGSWAKILTEHIIQRRKQATTTGACWSCQSGSEKYPGLVCGAQRDMSATVLLSHNCHLPPSHSCHQVVGLI
jgi:hypothetical protein